jgi:hypothetical protein
MKSNKNLTIRTTSWCSPLLLLCVLVPHAAQRHGKPAYKKNILTLCSPQGHRTILEHLHLASSALPPRGPRYRPGHDHYPPATDSTCQTNTSHSMRNLASTRKQLKHRVLCDVCTVTRHTVAEAGHNQWMHISLVELLHGRCSRGMFLKR